MTNEHSLNTILDTLRLQIGQHSARHGDYNSCRTALLEGHWATKEAQLQALSLLARCAAQQGEYDEARQYWLEALEVETSFSEAHIALRYLDQGRYQPTWSYLGAMLKPLVLLGIIISLMFLLLRYDAQQRQQLVAIAISKSVTQQVGEEIGRRLEQPLSNMSSLTKSLSAIEKTQSMLSQQLVELKTMQESNQLDVMQLGDSVSELRRVHTQVAQSVSQVGTQMDELASNAGAQQANYELSLSSMVETKERLASTQVRLGELEQSIATITDKSEIQKKHPPTWWKFWSRGKKNRQGDL